MALGLFGCSADISQYKGATPKLVLENYLQGHIKGSGMIQDYKNMVIKKFDFSGDASWKDSVGTFDEHMVYDDGSKDHRIWTIKKSMMDIMKVQQVMLLEQLRFMLKVML